MNTSKIVFVLILFLEQNYKSVGMKQKLIFQRDISEHCRRRVVPSIFLGRQVVDANARILQFSRLELPYNCFISIRTESGNNMVMVIVLPSNDLRKACRKEKEQLLVYEMGETFGGYWGPLPESVLKRDPVPPKVYTLKTTHSTTPILKTSTEEAETETMKQPTAPRKPSTDISSDYIEVEVPLLNVSVHYVPGKQGTDPLELEESFDFHHDVTPIPGVEYDRSILPLVQFRLVQPPGGQRRNEDEPPKYELDIVQEFTPDMRLTMPQLNPTSKRRNYKQRYQGTRRLNFKKHRTLFNSQRRYDRRFMPETITRRNDVTKYTFPTTRATVTKNKTRDSWQVIKDLMKKLDKTKESADDDEKTTLSVDDAMLLEKISNMNHNLSVYLSPKTPIYNSHDSTYISTNNVKVSTWIPASLPVKGTKQHSKVQNPGTKGQNTITSTIVTEDNITSEQSLNSKTSENLELVTETSFPKENRTNQKLITLLSTSETPAENEVSFEKIRVSETYLNKSSNETTVLKKINNDRVDFKNNKKIVTGSMVGHESWENLVQAAPEMVVLLNQTVGVVYDDVRHGNKTDDITKEFHETTHKDKLLKRKKRNIHSIAIGNARPNSLTTKRTMITTTQAMFQVTDMQEFAQLVELQDDELHGRVALRYLRQYVGPALFNLCDLNETTKRHVHLFNSSRIVLAISNFTLEKMAVIITSARTLLSGEMRCPKSQLECQVAGARVCLDSMVACDGVPNCGSYDIYDEDRLLCGSSVSLQHNVYLAAFTFLAVLLTLLYAVHYWLKRCVPKVADAFFVYTDGVENTLYLDSIMRSPNDTNDEDPKMVYHGHSYADDNIYDEAITEVHRSACQRFLRKICFCFRKKHMEIDEMEPNISPLNHGLSKKMYSFTELEISKMLPSFKETAVQTGDSIEMKLIEDVKGQAIGKPVRLATTTHDFSVSIQDSTLILEEPFPEGRNEDELNIIKFINAARTCSIESVSKQSTPERKKNEFRIELSEKEISSTTYDRPEQEHPGTSKKRKKDEEKVAPLNNTGKHLRFDEVTTTILSEEHDNEDDEHNINMNRRRSVALGESSWRGSRYLDTIDESDEHVGGKEHRHFWGTIKGKKSKKKMFF